MSNATVAGRIYFIQMGDSGPIKIGWSRDEDGIAKRLVACQTGNPERLRMVAQYDGTPADERHLHWRFTNYRMAGEWFLPSPGVLRAMTRGRPAWSTNRTIPIASVAERDKWLAEWDQRMAAYLADANERVRYIGEW